LVTQIFFTGYGNSTLPIVREDLGKGPSGCLSSCSQNPFTDKNLFFKRWEFFTLCLVNVKRLF
jgi:hypothetical protein